MSDLEGVNATELIEIARDAGLGNLTRSLTHEQLIAVLNGDHRAPGTTQDALETKRAKMQNHIRVNWLRLRSQLPGCTGKCTTYGCPDLIVQRCWHGMHKDML